MATIDDEVIDRRLAHLRRFMGTLKITIRAIFKTQIENAISALLHFQPLKPLKMVGHPCPARAP